MRNGFKVWDTDTHLRPTLEALEPYYDPKLRQRLPELEHYKRVYQPKGDERVTRTPGNHEYVWPGRVANKRVLGEAGPSDKPVRSGGKFAGTLQPRMGAEDTSADARIADMDDEGVDVQVMVTSFPHPVFLNDPELDLGFMRAFTRYADDFCAKYPHRLKALLPVLDYAPEESAAKIRRCARSSWLVGILPFESNDLPLDHPSLSPIWEAVDEAGLAVIHHSRAYTPPYFPGYRDLWDNIFLGRASSHPWGAMRSIGAFIGAGLLEKYRQLRFGILESGCGWLPFWARRLDDQVEYVGATAELRSKISEQMAGGRFFASLEMAEGGDMIKMVTDFLGTDVLMYASDYPHPECRFPSSVDYFLGFDELDGGLKRKLLWDNAVRFYGEP